MSLPDKREDFPLVSLWPAIANQGQETVVIDADRGRFSGTARTTEIPVRYQDV